MRNKNGWKLHKLDDLGFVGRGRSRHRPRNDPSLYGGPYPFIQTAEVRASDLYIRSYSQTYSEKGLAQSKMWEPNTLCIINAGENTGESAILDFNACFPDSIIAFIPKQNRADIRFIKYYLDYLKPQIRSITKGATQDNLSVNNLLSFDILITGIYTQTKIASILSSYDVLVQNCLRRIEVLDEMLDRIFKNWFVDFHIPQTELSLENTSIGKIPKGWNIGSIKDFVNFVRGIEPGSKNYLQEPLKSTVPFLRVGDLGSRNWSIHIPEELSKGKLLSKDNIVITLDGTVGIVKIGMEGCYSTGIRKVEIKNNQLISWGFLYCLLKSQYIQDVVQSHAKGTTILHAGSSIDYMDFPLPPESITKRFEKLASPMLRIIINLQEKIEILRKTRDLLLPKLISGEVDVEELDINTGTVYAEA